MIRTLQNLSFKIHSPSLLELVSVRDDINDPSAKVMVRYNGYKWWINYESRTANVARMFKSRDAAIQMIADRAP